MTQRFRKWPKRLKYVGKHVDLWEIVKICGKWLKYLINGLFD